MSLSERDIARSNLGRPHAIHSGVSWSRIFQVVDPDTGDPVSLESFPGSGIPLHASYEGEVRDASNELVAPITAELVNYPGTDGMYRAHIRGIDVIVDSSRICEFSILGLMADGVNSDLLGYGSVPVYKTSTQAFD